MAAPVVVTVRENSVVDLRPCSQPSRSRDALLRATAELREQVFRVDRRGRLHSRGLVGLVQADGVSVQILPKVQAGSTATEDAVFLLRLLSVAQLVPQRLVAPAQIGTDRLPLLEMVMRRAAEHMQEALGEFGVPRRYAEVREERETVLGVIDMERAMRQMPHERDRVPVIHAPLHSDNPLTRLLLSLAVTLGGITRSRRTRQLLDDVAGQLSGAGYRPLTEALLEPAGLREDEAHWSAEIDLARGLCTGLLPNPVSPGRGCSSALVFSLDDVFERIIRRSLARCLPGSGWAVAQHPPVRHFLTDTLTSKPRLRLRPDVLVASETKPVRLRVADAKWKTLLIGPAGLALDRSDVYQLSAYMNRYGLSEGMLLMPAADETRVDGPEPWRRRLQIQGSRATMDVVAIDVHALVGAGRPARDRALAQLRSAFTVAGA